MWTVFASRLMPFVGFDIICYVAGPTALAFWRFAVATMAGIVPAGFLLAHFGSAMVTESANRVALAALIPGLLIAVPLAVTWFTGKRARDRGGSGLVNAKVKGIIYDSAQSYGL